MSLDEMIINWRNQTAYKEVQIRQETLHFLFKEKSKNVLSRIHVYLKRELGLIILATISFDALFFMVEMPFTSLRLICFAVFNVITFVCIFSYLKTLNKSKLKYSDDLETNLRTIIQGLTQFRNRYKLINIPVVFVCILMFAGSHDLLTLVPWMILEVLLWRSILLPKMRARFQAYKTDLECTLRLLQESA
ncbi:hypothetical protein D4L85_24890 [Chryseolinea soli]|uniref:Uncharacterized protein n=1 Tax=Chryseolinea soli TaxID=2321403 RepID=A0A385SR42_9BACT|nr:hypothetical protein D4L85_24890 [Chryseolinea soli]